MAGRIDSVALVQYSDIFDKSIESSLSKDAEMIHTQAKCEKQETDPLCSKLFVEESLDKVLDKYSEYLSGKLDEVNILHAEIADLTSNIKVHQKNIKKFGVEINTGYRKGLSGKPEVRKKALLRSLFVSILYRWLAKLSIKVALISIVLVVGFVYYYLNTINESLVVDTTTIYNSLSTLQLFLYGGGAMLSYTLVVLVLFFFERKILIAHDIKMMRTQGDALKNIELHYYFSGVEISGNEFVGLVLPARKTKEKIPLLINNSYSNDVQETVNNKTFLEIKKKDNSFYSTDMDGNFYYPGENSFANRHALLVDQIIRDKKSILEKSIKYLTELGDKVEHNIMCESEINRINNIIEHTKTLYNIWSKVWVSREVFDFLTKRFDLFNSNDPAKPAGILLYGSEGNGKKYLAELIANSVACEFLPINISTLRTGDEVRELWGGIRKQSDLVIFIDHAERLFSKRIEDGEYSNREVMHAWVTEWDKIDHNRRIWVVLSATDGQDIHSDILKKLGSSRIEISPPDETGRQLIARKESSRIGLTVDVPGFIIEQTSGCSVKDIRSVVVEAKIHAHSTAPDEKSWQEALNAIVLADNLPKDPSKTWDNLILAKETKESLVNICNILRQADKYTSLNIPVPKAMLLYGPPGTGKTEIARTIANEGGLHFTGLTTADLKAGYIGQSGQLVKELFKKAREKSPSIIFIDEIDAVATSREGSDGDSFTNEIVTQLLQEIDGVKASEKHVFVLGATNLLEQIDSAMLSRFNKTIEIGLPDENSRLLILLNFLKSAPNPDFDIEEAAKILAEKTTGKSGRYIKNLVNSAIERAVMRSSTPESVSLSMKELMDEIEPDAKEVSEEDMAEIWSSIVLNDDTQTFILSKLKLFNKADPASPRGLLLYGPPGTGKTEVARKIAQSTNCHFMPLSIPDLKAGFIGQSAQNVRRVWDEARAHGRCVMFVDECEGLFSVRGSTDTDGFTNDIVQAFLAEWDGLNSTGQIWVVGATNRRELLDGAIVSRFGTDVEISLPDADSRIQILTIEIGKLGRSFDIPKFVAQETNGFSGRTLSMLVKDLCAMVAEAEINDDHWYTGINRYRTSGSTKVDKAKSWDSLILAPETKQNLMNICKILSCAEQYSKIGVPIPKASLLYGPPGTGKTEIARTIASESGLQFIGVTTADIKAGYIGQSGQKVKEIFERARTSSPSILFIDEIESVAVARGTSGSDQFTNEIVTQLLQEIDGIKSSDQHVFVLAATNIPEAIDSAVRSRFNQELEIPLPDEEGRHEILKILLSSAPRVSFDIEKSSKLLAPLLEGKSGRYLKNLVTAGVHHAVMRVDNPEDVALTMEDIVAEAIRDNQEHAQELYKLLQ